MLLISLLLAVFLSACGQIGDMVKNAGQPSTETASTTDRSIDQYQLEPYNGPKARVTVSRFEDQTAKGSGVVYGGYPGLQWYTPQIGSGMADMLGFFPGFVEIRIFGIHA
jgi:curli biogenesis system outer membrane secretion channel CsgG